MTRCIIKANTMTLYNNVAFADINDDCIAIGYLMIEGNVTYQSKETISDNFTFNNKIDAITFAMEYLSKCESLSSDWTALENYIHATAQRMDSTHDMTA